MENSNSNWSNFWGARQPRLASSGPLVTLLIDNGTEKPVNVHTVNMWEIRRCWSRFPRAGKQERNMENYELSSGQQRATARITLGLLNSIDENRAVTQRGIAADLGIAVGLVNAYLKRCISKGLIKVHQVPRRRYAYYLTPKGFAEKSRLTASYLLHSFEFFRQARASCEEVLSDAAARGWTSLVLVGRSDMAEIALVCALHHPLRIVALIDKNASIAETSYGKIPYHAGFRDVFELFDGAVITNIEDTLAAYHYAVAELGSERVLVPSLLAQALSKKGKRGRNYEP